MAHSQFPRFICQKFARDFGSFGKFWLNDQLRLNWTLDMRA